MKPRQMLLIVAILVVVAAAAIFFFLEPAISPTLPETAATATPAAPGSLPPASATPAQSGELMVAGPLGEKTLGDPKAPNVVIEYASMTCSHCKAFATEVFKPFKEKYIDTGKVYFIFREFPLDAIATTAAMLARCAPEERFFPIVDLFFETQMSWATASDPQAALRDLTKQAGISQETFDACLKDQKVLDAVNWSKNNGAQKFGVDSTPTFFFNGKKVDGEQTLPQIDKLLAG